MLFLRLGLESLFSGLGSALILLFQLSFAGSKAAYDSGQVLKPFEVLG